MNLQELLGNIALRSSRRGRQTSYLLPGGLGGFLGQFRQQGGTGMGVMGQAMLGSSQHPFRFLPGFDFLGQGALGSRRRSFGHWR